MLPLSPTVRMRVEAARRLGYSVENLDPETGYLYEVRKGDRRRVLVGAFSPHNDATSARIAEDKFHTALLVRRLGLRVPGVTRCLRPGRFEHEDFSAHTGLDPAHRFASAHGFPLIVKPNRGARGRDVQVVNGEDEMVSAIERVWRHDYLALVQEAVEGIDVRLDFLQGEYLFGYVRRPVSLEGDGRSTVGQLLAAVDPRFSGDAFHRRIVDDPIWIAATAKRALGLDSVLPEGETLRFESTVMNLNRLCVGELVRRIPDAWLHVGLRIGEAIGLRHFGIDFKTRNALDDDPESVAVLEVNASPSVIQMSQCGHYEEALAAEIAILGAALEG